MNKKTSFDISSFDSANLSHLIKAHTAKWKPLTKKSNFLKSILQAPNNRLFLDIDERDAWEKNQKNDEKLIQDINCVLEIAGFTFIDLENKVASKDKKNFTKIGRILHKEGLVKLEEKWKKYCNDSAPKKDVKICLSLNPVDILSASYCRSWNSCISPPEGNYSYLADRILRPNRFSFIAYLVYSDDIEIKKPLGRRLIHGFFAEKYSRTENPIKLDKKLWYYNWNKIEYTTSFVFIPDSVYGNFPFQKTLNKYLSTINSSTYCLFNVKHTYVGYYNNSLCVQFDDRKSVIDFVDDPFRNVNTDLINKLKKTKKLSGYDSVLFGTFNGPKNNGPYKLNEIFKSKKINLKEKQFLIQLWPKLSFRQQARLCEIFDMGVFLKEKLINFDFYLKYGKIKTKEEIEKIYKEIEEKELELSRLKEELQKKGF